MSIRVQSLPDGTPVAYTMWLSAQDTYDWAHKAGAEWPCSVLSDRRLVVRVDSNGLYDLRVDGCRVEDVDPHELEAIVTDHLPAECRHLWPAWSR